jgi:hypothetical protein
MLKLAILIVLLNQKPCVGFSRIETVTANTWISTLVA